MLRFRKATKPSGENHQFIINKKSKKLIIFFSATGTKPNIFNFFGVGNKLDFNILFVNNGKNEWYQNGIPSLGKTFDETLSNIKKWVDYLGVTEVYTCGQGMGAYGALLYGVQLDSKVLAFGPETILNEEGARSVSHVPSPLKVKFNLVELLSQSSSTIYIYAGEDDPTDIYQASKVASFVEFPNVTVCSLGELNHNIAKYLRQKGRLLELLEDFIGNKPLPKMPEEGDAFTIVGFAESYYAQGKYFKNKEWKLSSKYGRTAVSKYPTCAYAQYMLGLSYVQLGQLLDGLQHLSIARSLVPANLEYQFAVANCLRRMGKMTKARYLHQKILQVNKDYAKSHYDLSLIYSKLGDKKGAIARAKHALRVEPKSASFQKRVEKLTQVKKK